MQALLTFNNVAFAQNDAWTVRVKVGEVFDMRLVEPGDDPLQWATTKDPILDVSEVDPTLARIKALNKGTSKVLLLNAADHAVFRLTIEVFNPDEAAGFDIPPPVQEPA